MVGSCGSTSAHATTEAPAASGHLGRVIGRPRVDDYQLIDEWLSDIDEIASQGVDDDPTVAASLRAGSTTLIRGLTLQCARRGRSASPRTRTALRKPLSGAVVHGSTISVSQPDHVCLVGHALLSRSLWTGFDRYLVVGYPLPSNNFR